MPAYRLDNLTKRFARVAALDGVYFEARAGELMVILGPTGAGKTTLLRTIAGLERPDAGEILEDNIPITQLAPAYRDMAMVFQNFSLYPRLTVRDNLAFGLRPKWRNISAAEIDRRVAWAADLLGLTSKLASRPTELSGGQQQRVAIGRAIVREPKLFLFDEPLASLDAKLRESMTLEIHRLQRRLSVTMLYVTHDSIEAMSLADRIVVLDRGRILQIGTPDELYQKPATPRVARMLGSPPINLMPASLAARLFKNVPLAADTVTVGIRPEHLQVRPDPSGKAIVRVVEHLGPMTVAYLTVNAGGNPVDVRAVLGPRDAITVGQKVTLSISPADALSWPTELAANEHE